MPERIYNPITLGPFGPKDCKSVLVFRAAIKYFPLLSDSGGHFTVDYFTGMPPLPLRFSISQNPAKDQALAALPPVAALVFNIGRG